MKIKFNVKNGKFFYQLRDSLRTQKEVLNRGQQIDIKLNPPGGFAGDFLIQISDDASGFDVNGISKNPSRFPARIKAMATVLHHEGFRGRYHVLYSTVDDIMTVKKMD